MEHVETEETANRCYGVTWTDDNSVLCATNSGVDVRDAFLKVETTKNIPDQSFTLSAALIDHTIYTYTFSNPRKQCTAWFGSLHDTPTQHILHTES